MDACARTAYARTLNLPAEELEPLLAGIVHAGEPLGHPHVRRRRPPPSCPIRSAIGEVQPPEVATVDDTSTPTNARSSSVSLWKPSLPPTRSTHSPYGGPEMSSIFQTSPPRVTTYAVFPMISSDVG
jgi:hypothetical protein